MKRLNMFSTGRRAYRFACRSAALLLTTLFFIAPSAATEQILSYDSDIAIQADGSLDVTERITVRAEGSNIRRGIYRDFPTRYKDRYGNNVVVDFDMIDVTRNGAQEPWFTEKMSNGVRVNTGNDDFLPVPADYTYVIHYRTTRQMGFFPDHDELYWNAIGTGWMFPIMAGTVEVRLPSPVPIADMRAEGFTGAQGAHGDAFIATLPAPGVAHWRLTRMLAPMEGLTTVLSFPKGLIAVPTRSQKVGWFLKDNRGVLVALLGLLVLTAYCLTRWRKVGRDPRPGVIITRYDPPEGHSPAGLRYVDRMGYDTRCFSSDLLDMAVDGDVRILRDKHLIKDTWKLQRLHDKPADDTLQAAPVPAQQALLKGLFPGKTDVLELKNTNASTMQLAQLAHTSALKNRYEPDYFKRNGGNIGIALLIAAATIVLALLVGRGGGVLVIILIALVMLPILITFGILIKAPSPTGRKLMDYTEGLKLYLSVAERDELASMPGPTGSDREAPPPLDADRYQRLLPYAVALEVEDAWTNKFTLAVGAAAAAATTAAITWYQGGHVGDLGSLTRAVGSSLSSQIASSSSPPGSSSGSSGGGGGGSSGGGGGGGGGGGR